MKIYSKILSLVACAALCMNITSCSDKSEDEPTAKTEISSVSVAEGAEIDPETKAITVTYTTDIILNHSAAITLNGSSVSATVKDGNTIDIAVSLRKSTEYELAIPADAVFGRGTSSYAPALNLKFKTSEGSEPVNPDPVTPDFLPLLNEKATKEAQNVYKFFVEQHGKKILSGAMANVNNNNDFAGWIKKVTGKDVAITGYDFIHLPESGQNWIDYSDINPAKEQWAANGLVSYMWHWRVPTDKEAYDSKNYSRYDSSIKPANGGSGTNFDIREAVKEGTWQHECILADIDKVAGYLKLLQDAGIPVLWRPLHEAAGSYKYNGAWFWWGRYGDEPTKELWKLMYDRLVNHHGLNNLIWVWTAQCEEGYYDRMAASYPGNDWCDVVGVDIYADNDSSQKAAYNALVNMTGGKRLVTLSETGRIQNPDKCFADGAHWSWFNLWYTYDQHKGNATTDGFGNTVESLKAVLGSSYVINRGDMPSLK